MKQKSVVVLQFADGQLPYVLCAYRWKNAITDAAREGRDGSHVCAVTLYSTTCTDCGGVGGLVSTIGYTTNDCRKTYEALAAKGVEFTQEPVEQPYGIDVGLRDPFGNHIRIVQLKAAS